MGFLDDIFNQPFGGMFDFNGDGKTDLGENLLGYMIMNDSLEQEEKESSFSPSTLYSSFSNDEDDANDDWQFFADEGAEYGIDPYNYDTEEEYLEAVEDAELGIDIGEDDNWI